MNSQRYQPVNEWNSCDEAPLAMGDEAWRNVVPETRGQREATTHDGDAPVLVETANSQDGATQQDFNNPQNTRS